MSSTLWKFYNNQVRRIHVLEECSFKFVCMLEIKKSVKHKQLSEVGH